MYTQEQKSRVVEFVKGKLEAAGAINEHQGLVEEVNVIVDEVERSVFGGLKTPYEDIDAGFGVTINVEEADTYARETV